MDSLGCHPELKRRRSASRLQQTKQLLPRPWNQERLLLFLSRAGVAPDPSLHGILSSFFDDLSVKLLLYIRGTLGGVILDQSGDDLHHNIRDRSSSGFFGLRIKSGS